MRYPDMDYLRSYPTLGPQSSDPVPMDINGLAASLELYLGEPNLLDANGHLHPIQWHGFDDKLKRYQGEITAKREVQQRFYGQMSILKADPSGIDSFDWRGIDAILTAILMA